MQLHGHLVGRLAVLVEKGVPGELVQEQEDDRGDEDGCDGNQEEPAHDVNDDPSHRRVSSSWTGMSAYSATIPKLEHQDSDTPVDRAPGVRWLRPLVDEV